ncbi:class I SAM-dependent methyltransferase [Patescibacteria group bacterium]|nr:class I SAM-dependent methyltransferase [Patescibacteria group bacterium]
MNQSFLNPEEVLDQLELRLDMVAAEFGCGSGGFAIPLAKRLEEGLVYGLDIQRAPLSALKSRALLENITNIRTICSDLEKPKGSTLTRSSVDLVFIPNVLFQIKDKNAIISEAERVLKNKGKLVVIDWAPKAPQGPEEGRISPKEVKKITEKIGFKLEKEFEAGKYHFGLIFEKP